MKHAQAAAHRSSWSATGSDWRTTDATISVGARSSLTPPSSEAAFSAASARGPTTRNRQGCVRWWLGAHRARSNSSSSVVRGTGSRPNTLWVRRERTAASNDSVAAGWSTRHGSVGGGCGGLAGRTPLASSAPRRGAAPSGRDAADQPDRARGLVPVARAAGAHGRRSDEQQREAVHRVVAGRLAGEEVADAFRRRRLLDDLDAERGRLLGAVRWRPRAGRLAVVQVEGELDREA